MFPRPETATAIDVLNPVSAARRTKGLTSRRKKECTFANTEEKYPTPDEESEAEGTKRKAS